MLLLYLIPAILNYLILRWQTINDIRYSVEDSEDLIYALFMIFIPLINLGMSIYLVSATITHWIEKYCSVKKVIRILFLIKR